MMHRGMSEQELREMGLEFVPAETEEDYDFYIYDLGDGSWLELYVLDGVVVDLQRCADF